MYVVVTFRWNVKYYGICIKQNITVFIFLWRWCKKQHCTARTSDLIVGRSDGSERNKRSNGSGTNRRSDGSGSNRRNDESYKQSIGEQAMDQGVIEWAINVASGEIEGAMDQGMRLNVCERVALHPKFVPWSIACTIIILFVPLLYHLAAGRSL